MKRTLLILLTSAIVTSLSLSQSSAEGTLSIGEGWGLPGTTDKLVAVSLENQTRKVNGIQLDICEMDGYLSCSDSVCETTDRSSGFTCSQNQVDNQCCRVVLVSLGGNTIEEGEGPVFYVGYNVSANAPDQECRELIPENIQLVDEENLALAVNPESGEFCFSCQPGTDCKDNDGSTRPTTTTSSATTTTSSISNTTSSVPVTTSTTYEPEQDTTTIKAETCLLNQMYGKASAETEFLRFVRDNVLSQHPEGRALIRLYYQWSAFLVQLTANDPDFEDYLKEVTDEFLLLFMEGSK